ncbi:hypothetical protein J3F84DRAFT_230073 [Trichoderma pleuroticola]
MQVGIRQHCPVRALALFLLAPVGDLLNVIKAAGWKNKWPGGADGFCWTAVRVSCARPPVLQHSSCSPNLKPPRQRSIVGGDVDAIDVNLLHAGTNLAVCFFASPGPSLLYGPLSGAIHHPSAKQVLDKADPTVETARADSHDKEESACAISC